MKEFIKVNVLNEREMGTKVEECGFVEKIINLNMVNDITPIEYPLYGENFQNNYAPAIRFNLIDQDDHMIFEYPDDRDEMFEKISHSIVGIDLTK